ncbi:sugar phosphate isomerase/epimerase [Candidatus Woesearchaeota archaeon]|nr:sugar phosphate isomerase/epimerase [Candidatus Woesearchaeota archaeon]
MEFRYYTHHPMADYANTMDPDMYGHDVKERPSTSIKDIGMSVPMGISAQNVAGIYSKIRMGAGSIEIGFPAAVQGQRQAQTPGMYGEDQRQAIRELANINEIKLTTHAPYPMMGMMGRDQRDNFSLTNAYQNLNEIQRAIDFAADTAGSGSVVVHTGEWERPLTDITLDDPTMERNLSYGEDGTLMFRKRLPEAADAGFILLDDRTSQKMETVQKDRLVSVPKWVRADRDYDGKYQDSIHPTQEDQQWMLKYKGKPVRVKKGDYIDYEGNKIIDPYNAKFGRVPEFNDETRSFEVDYKDFDDFKEEAREQTEFNKRHWKDMKGKEWFDDEMWYYGGEVYPDESFIHATLETNEGHSRGWAVEFAVDAKRNLEGLKKLEKAKEFYEKLDKSIPEDEKWKIMKQDSELMRYVSEFIPPETKHPLQMIQEKIDDVRARIEYARQSSASQLQQAEDTAETKKHIVTPIKRFKLHCARLYAEAGMRSLERTKDPDNPVFLAIENLFPERFGGHPEELKYVIDESRKWFVKLLTEPTVKHGVITKDMTLEEKEGKTPNPYYDPKMSRQEAEKLAERHIKATWDTGHANMWRKFWQVKPGQKIDEADKDFKRWYTKEFEKLAEGGYIGNIHLTDNFGFQDDHIAPGQGNAPIREVMDILKKHGYDKAITVEPGADASTDLSDFHGLMKTWKYLGSPVYGIGAGAPQVPQTWGNVQYSYFGQNRPPYFVFGAYAPSNDWTLWSQVPME